MTITQRVLAIPPTDCQLVWKTSNWWWAFNYIGNNNNKKRRSTVFDLFCEFGEPKILTSIYSIYAYPSQPRCVFIIKKRTKKRRYKMKIDNNDERPMTAHHHWSTNSWYLRAATLSLLPALILAYVFLLLLFDFFWFLLASVNIYERFLVCVMKLIG